MEKSPLPWPTHIFCNLQIYAVFAWLMLPFSGRLSQYPAAFIRVYLKCPAIGNASPIHLRYFNRVYSNQSGREFTHEKVY